MMLDAAATRLLVSLLLTLGCDIFIVEPEFRHILTSAPANNSPAHIITRSELLGKPADLPKKPGKKSRNEALLVDFAGQPGRFSPGLLSLVDKKTTRAKAGIQVAASIPCLEARQLLVAALAADDTKNQPPLLVCAIEAATGPRIGLLLANDGPYAFNSTGGDSALGQELRLQDLLPSIPRLLLEDTIHRFACEPSSLDPTDETPNYQFPDIPSTAPWIIMVGLLLIAGGSIASVWFFRRGRERAPSQPEAIPMQVLPPVPGPSQNAATVAETNL